MTAAWMWARAELRARWRSWLVLGLLAGATAGIAAAGVAGARRSEAAVPGFVAAQPGELDAAVLPNDPAFDADQRAAVAALPEVRETLPFYVPFLLATQRPSGLDGTLLPRTPRTALVSEGVLVEGRHTNPNRADEATIDEKAARHYHLGLGSSFVVVQPLPPGVEEQLPGGIVPPDAKAFRQKVRIVGIMKSVSSEESWSPSSGLAKKFDGQIVGITNLFVDLRRNDRATFAAFQRGVQEIVGHPVNVERGVDLLGIDKIQNVTDVERDGLLLFAFAVVLGGGVLVGQALVRAVTASAAQLDAWRAMGADRRLAIVGMTVPALLAALAGVVVAFAVAVALSPRFPIGLGRRYDLDVGVHVDALVVVTAIVLLVVAIAAVSVVAAWWRVERGEHAAPTTSRTARWATAAGLPPSMLIGARLAVEPGRGRRAVPVRSALVGAVAGVLGVVACLTLRGGVVDAAENPRRSGVVWDYLVAAGPGTVAPQDLKAIADTRGVDAVTRALWARAVSIDDVPTSTFGIRSVRGRMPLVMLQGRAPAGRSEIAFAPTTAEQLGVDVGDTVRVGEAGRRTEVVGIALLPASSHTDYDQGAWLTLPGLQSALGGAGAIQDRPDDFEDYQLIRWRNGADVSAAEAQVKKIAARREYFAQPSELPTAVVDLGNLSTVPFVLAVFFGLLACATVAHALVTTVRRRRVDFAVLRSIGLTRRQSRLSIAWQATLLAVIGLVVGVPLGIVVGREIWQLVAEGFPVAFVPPLEAVVVLVAVPVALAVAQLLAAGPAQAAARIRPAQTLRTE